MSKIRDYNINDDSSVTIGNRDEEIDFGENVDTVQIRDIIEPIIQRAKDKGQEIINEAREQARKEVEELKASKEAIQREIELIKQSASQESGKQGYDKGYSEGIEKANEEIKEKLEAVDLFAKSNFEIKNKILSSTKTDILNLCFEISKKVCLEAINEEILGKIIDKALLLLETKSQVNVMISEKLASKLPENFSEKFMNVRVIVNPKIADDSIIVESLAGNVDCSISTQIDKIANEILNGSGN